MATELPRPGVQVIQEFESAAPTVVQPTLVPFVCGPAKEIVEFTDSDGLINPDAEQGDYDQLPQTIGQSAFPSPRGNIAEVNVEEATIRLAMLFGGSLTELDRDPGSAFLASHNEARRAAFRTLEFVTATGLDLDGKVFVFAIDQLVPLNSSDDYTVTFATVGGGNLTPAQIVSQINAVVGVDVAEEIVSGSNSRIQVSSQIYGSGSSVTVRAGGSANTDLGTVADDVEYRVTGGGFYAEDQANNTTLSAYIKWSQGVYLEDSVAASFPAVSSSEMGFGQIATDTDGVDTYAQAVTSDITFTGAGSIDLHVGDYFVGDGNRPNSTAEVQRVEATRFKLGIVNSSLSTFDTDGDVLTAVYDDSRVNTLLAAVPYAPRYAWFRARGITEDNASATAGTLTGSIQGNPAELGSVTGTAITFGAGLALAGLTLVTQSTVDGVVQDENTFTFTGGPFADMAALLAAIGTNIPNVIATEGSVSDTLVLSTDATGADQSLQLKATSTALTALNLAAGTYTGKDVEFLDVPAVLTTADEVFPYTDTAGEILVIEGTDDGGVTWTAFSRTYTFPVATSPANIAALLAKLQTAADWDGAALPTEFVITNSGDKLIFTSAATGSLAGIRVGATSDCTIGVATASEIELTNGDSDLGEENISGLIFKLKLNDRPQVYTAVFTSDSLDDAVAEINETVGTTVASIGGAGLDQLVLTSPLVGAASKVLVYDDGTNNKAMSALGFTTGNVEDAGSGRPNADFQVDGSGNVLLGAEILRSTVDGIPFGPGASKIYIQYTGLRLDVSPQASEAALISLTNTTDLETVLSPINSDNPLGMAMFFQLINAPGITCKGMGISATTATAPEGTAAAYAEVLDFIESEEVYALAPLTHDTTIQQLFKTHVDYMSAAEQKGERILLQNPDVPTRYVDTSIGSGLSADSTATNNQLVIDSNPSQALIDAGINPALPIDEDEDLFVEVTVDQEVRKYNVSAINGTLCTFRTSFSTGFNTDGFYSEETLSETVLNADWSMRVRGALLVIAGSTLPDKTAIAETINAQNLAIADRRVVSIFPDYVKASLSGTEEIIDAYYAAAAMTGMIAFHPPQQGFTNLPMTGFTGVVGSNDTFSATQMDIMAGGGTYTIIQEAAGAPVASRHQLTTDVSSIESRELSITKVVDYVAKFMRAGLRNFIGTFNITQPFLDSLSTVIQGMLTFLEEGGVILGGDLNNLIQDTNNPDTVLVDVTLDVPYPCNYIRLTLVI